MGHDDSEKLRHFQIKVVLSIYKIRYNNLRFHEISISTVLLFINEKLKQATD